MRRKLFLSFLSLMIAVPFYFLTTVQAGAENAVEEANTRVELIPSVKKISPGEPFWIAVRLQTEPGWHTYWRNPGDSGLATRIDWQLPEGFSTGETQWPYPERLDVDDLTTYGYEDGAVLLTQVAVPPDANPEAVTIFEAQVRWLACKVECVPGSASLSFQLPSEAALAEDHHDVFTAAFTKLPLKDIPWDVSGFYTPKEFIISLSPPYPLRSKPYFEFFPFDDDVIDHHAPQLVIEEGGNYKIILQKSAVLMQNPERLSGVVVSNQEWNVWSPQKAVSIDVPLEQLVLAPQTEEQPIPPRGVLMPLWIALVSAFIGGLILNLMPCVLPVLSLKILGLIEQAQENRQKVFIHGLCFTGGVLASFWVLAALLFALRNTGKLVGWGFQFQSPEFLILLALLFFGLALNLFGVFEIGTALTTISGKSGHGYQSSFLNGILATIVATPCTAPFMGSAIGYAVVQPAAVSFFVFSFLGLGMAFPYLTLCVFPQYLRFIPKPGEWMVTLKQAFGFIFVATSVWLLWVLNQQQGGDAVIRVLIACIGLAVSGWILGRWAGVSASSGQKMGVKLIAAAIALAGIVFAVNFSRAAVVVPADTGASVSDPVWQAFSEKKVEEYRRKGRPVFVDFTASWCLTCQVNKKTSLEQLSVLEAFRQKNIVLLKADWTNYDEKITQALAKFGKTSVPVYVLYPADTSRPPMLLPEILTPDIVKEYLSKL